MKTIEVTDVVLRDAHQSLLATRVSFDDMQPALADLDEAGYWSLECWGGATFDACIRFLNEDPWKRLRRFKQQLPKTPLQMLLRGQNLVGYRHYGDDVVDRFADRAAENGCDVFRIFDAMNDPRNLERAVAAVKRTGKHAQGTISYTVSPIHSIERFVELARRLQDMGVDSICIKDMAALIKPQAAYDLVTAIKQACGDDLRLHLHVHATTGVTMVSLMKAVEAGVDNVDTAVSSLSLGTGHNPTEAFCEMLEGTDYQTRIDLERVERAKRHFAAVRKRYRHFATQFVGVETSIFHSQIPGGMLSNMESQLEQQGAADRIDEVMEEVPRVRKDAGYPPLVTPSSQIVGSQAVFNVMMGRYKRMTAEFQDLMLGYYGDTTGQMNPEVVAIAEQQADKPTIDKRPADLIGAEFDQLRTEAEKLEGYDGSDEDVLSYALFPKVAARFFQTRDDGPKDLGEDPDERGSDDAPRRSRPAGETTDARTAEPRDYTITVDGRSYQVTVARGAGGQSQVTNAQPMPAGKQSEGAPASAQDDAGVALRADLAGTVLRLALAPGEHASEDQCVLVLEAMKMETEVAAPRAGTLLRYTVSEGDTVQVGDVLADLG